MAQKGERGCKLPSVGKKFYPSKDLLPLQEHGKHLIDAQRAEHNRLKRGKAPGHRLPK